MAKHAHEMETKLQEGTWYIRGCEELKIYFDKIKCIRSGDPYALGYYINAGYWNCEYVENLQHRTEITLQDYLDSLKPQSFDELDLEFEEKERSAIEFLKSRGYLVFPKAEEGDFPDLSGLEGDYMETSNNFGTTWIEDIIVAKLGEKEFLTVDIDVVTKVRHIQPELTPEEIVEKLGKDYLLNLIKEK